MQYILQSEASKKINEGEYVMKNVEKDVVKKEKIKGRNFYKLLEKICKDFNISNSKEIIVDFIKKQ